MELQNPSNKHLQEILNYKEQKFGSYDAQEKALKKLFFCTYPKNKDLEEVLIKVVSLDSLYSTNLRMNIKSSDMAEHIIKLDFDERIKKGDLSLVSDIANLNCNYYSFASKYCTMHNQDDFVIYDSIVVDLLKRYRKKDSFLKFEDDDLKDYEKYKGILKSFKDYYRLVCSFRKLDWYLWTYGKMIREDEKVKKNKKVSKK